MSRNWTCWLVGGSLTLVLLFSEIVNAAIMYPDQMGSTVWFRAISEDSGTDPLPLYGAPSVSGNSIDFNLVSFNSFSAGALGNDLTDGALTMMIEAKPGNFIPKILYEESGDFTLIGFGTDATLASVVATFFIDINEVDGNALNPPVNLQVNMQISPSSGVYQLATLGGGPFQQGNWAGSLMIDVEQALMDAGESFANGATKVTVTLDNKLATLSEDGTSAFIAKKDFGGTTITIVPEPSCMALAGMALLFPVLARAGRQAVAARRR
jgi:hypothetical protein